MSKTIGEVWVDTYADQLEKISTLEDSFNRITLDLVEAKRNHALELGERLKGEERVAEQAESCLKELQRQLDSSNSIREAEKKILITEIEEHTATKICLKKLQEAVDKYQEYITNFFKDEFKEGG